MEFDHHISTVITFGYQIYPFNSIEGKPKKVRIHSGSLIL